ncbi:MAG: ABC transporter permease [Gemmatimonadetes bacterium]|nr:ABC transporter permease [Gemmatimonadota bacterium]
MFKPFAELWRYRDLAGILIAKELKLRYRRSVLGFAWTMLNPLMTMLILTVVFSHVMRVQVDHFPVFVLSALLPWNFFSQSLSGGAYSIIHNESLLRNVRVPRAVFPMALVGSHLVNFLLALVPLLLVMVWQGVSLRPSALLLPYCLLALACFTTGVVLVLSAWTVFFRDLGQIVEVSITALFYLTPIIYPLSILPERYAGYFKLNPLYHLVTPFRTIFFEGTVPEPASLLVSGAIGLVALLGGFAVFRSRQDHFLQYLS